MDWINFDKLAHITRYIADIIVRIDQPRQDLDNTIRAMLKGNPLP